MKYGEAYKKSVFTRLAPAQPTSDPEDLIVNDKRTPKQQNAILIEAEIQLYFVW